MWEILGIDATTDIEQIFEAYASKVAEYGESDALTQAYEEALVYAEGTSDTRFDDLMQELSLMDVKERIAWQKWFDALDRLEVYERFEDVEILNTSLQRVDVRLIPSGVMFEIILPHLRKIAHYNNENESELKMTMDHFESYVRFREASRIGWRDQGKSKRKNQSNAKHVWSVIQMIVQFIGWVTVFLLIFQMLGIFNIFGTRQDTRYPEREITPPTSEFVHYESQFSDALVEAIQEGVRDQSLQAHLDFDTLSRLETNSCFDKDIDYDACEGAFLLDLTERQYKRIMANSYLQEGLNDDLYDAFPAESIYYYETYYDEFADLLKNNKAYVLNDITQGLHLNEALYDEAYRAYSDAVYDVFFKQLVQENHNINLQRFTKDAL
ncbi:hypothetical protein [Erysipelothrix aquatica]|uniref:hypothetical protein n=1 Tax=Erysipelothrix aquatica TaxID=2683714 RepID=UPI00135C18F3|nr:hypothetical protein [Erysipelothrix aquatica]